MGGSEIQRLQASGKGGSSLSHIFATAVILYPYFFCSDWRNSDFH